MRGTLHIALGTIRTILGEITVGIILMVIIAIIVTILIALLMAEVTIPHIVQVRVVHRF